MSLSSLILVAFIPWYLAMLAKAVRCLRQKRAYVHRYWDGGKLLLGRAVAGWGIHMKLSQGAIGACTCAAILGGVLPDWSGYLLVGIVIADSLVVLKIGAATDAASSPPLTNAKL